MRVDHIGFVVKNAEKYRKNLPIQTVVKSLYDPLQDAYLELIDGGGVMIELIEPQNEDAFTWNFLQKGGGYHHICYECDSLKEAKDAIKNQFMVEVLGPIPAPLLDGQVLFARSRNREIVEFVWRK